MAKKEAIHRLISYWKENKTPFDCNTAPELKGTLDHTDIALPLDFQELYQKINGTIDYDNEGFLFHRWRDLVTMGEKFSLSQTDKLFNIVIFIDYMQSSWWYGVATNDSGYEIGIIPNGKVFKPITNSLDTFIDLYINDSEVLYDYGDL